MDRLLGTRESRSDLTIANQEILQQLKCNVCECYLSVEPIRLIGNAYVCGRCPGEGFRVEPMETLAKQFKYPCRYKEQGCELYLAWGDAVGHERVCEFEKVNCIISNCQWMGAKANMFKHFQNEHPTLIITENNSIKLFDGRHSVLKLLRSFNDAVFVIELYRREKNIQCKVWMFLSKMNSSSYMYQIDFLTKKTRLTFLHEVTKGEHFQLDKNALTSIFQDIHKVTVQININYSDKMTITNEKLPELKCSACQSALINEIYSLKCGHSICNNCTKRNQAICTQVHNYTYCNNLSYRNNSSSTITRNYTLESFRDSFKNL